MLVLWGQNRYVRSGVTPRSKYCVVATPPPKVNCSQVGLLTCVMKWPWDPSQPFLQSNISILKGCSDLSMASSLCAMPILSSTITLIMFLTLLSLNHLKKWDMCSRPVPGYELSAVPRGLEVRVLTSFRPKSTYWRSSSTLRSL